MSICHVCHDDLRDDSPLEGAQCPECTATVHHRCLIEWHLRGNGEFECPIGHAFYPTDKDIKEVDNDEDSLTIEEVDVTVREHRKKHRFAAVLGMLIGVIGCISIVLCIKAYMTMKQPTFDNAYSPTNECVGSCDTNECVGSCDET